MTVWIKLKEKNYLGIRYDSLTLSYIYVLRNLPDKSKVEISDDSPNKLTDEDEVYFEIEKHLKEYKISKPIKQVLEELQNVLDNPELSINPNDDSTLEEEIKPIETDDNISPNDNETETDDNPNSDYIPSLLEKYDNDILKMLDDNLTEYVGDKTNLAMLILSVVAVKCGLKSFIININGDSLSGKSTLIKTLFDLIPQEMIKNHNNSTISGIIRDSWNLNYYDGSFIYLGNITDERKKQIAKIEELTLSLYKEHTYISTMGSKSSTDKTMKVEIETDAFLSLTKSITQYKSSNTEINDITLYLTVKPIPKNDLVQQLQFNHQDNNQEFLEEHQNYIDNLSPMDIEEEFFNNQELLEHINEQTIDLNYEELHRYQMLYLSYCIYLNITPSIESFDRFQSMTPKDTTLTDEEEALLKFLKKHHTDKANALSSKNRAKFKYFSTDNLKSYHSNIKVIKEADNLNKTLNNLVSKGALNKNADNLFYLND